MPLMRIRTSGALVSRRLRVMKSGDWFLVTRFTKAARDMECTWWLSGVVGGVVGAWRSSRTTVKLTRGWLSVQREVWFRLWNVSKCKEGQSHVFVIRCYDWLMRGCSLIGHGEVMATVDQLGGCGETSLMSQVCFQSVNCTHPWNGAEDVVDVSLI